MEEAGTWLEGRLYCSVQHDTGTDVARNSDPILAQECWPLLKERCIYST